MSYVVVVLALGVVVAVVAVVITTGIGTGIGTGTATATPLATATGTSIATQSGTGTGTGIGTGTGTGTGIGTGTGTGNGTGICIHERALFIESGYAERAVILQTGPREPFYRKRLCRKSRIDKNSSNRVTGAFLPKAATLEEPFRREFLKPVGPRMSEPGNPRQSVSQV